MHSIINLPCLDIDCVLFNLYGPSTSPIYYAWVFN